MRADSASGGVTGTMAGGPATFSAGQQCSKRGSGTSSPLDVPRPLSGAFPEAGSNAVQLEYAAHRRAKAPRLSRAACSPGEARNVPKQPARGSEALVSSEAEQLHHKARSQLPVMAPGAQQAAPSGGIAPRSRRRAARSSSQAGLPPFPGVKSTGVVAGTIGRGVAGGHAELPLNRGPLGRGAASGDVEGGVGAVEAGRGLFGGYFLPDVDGYMEPQLSSRGPGAWATMESWGMPACLAAACGSNSSSNPTSSSSSLVLRARTTSRGSGKEGKTSGRWEGSRGLQPATPQRHPRSKLASDATKRQGTELR